MELLCFGRSLDEKRLLANQRINGRRATGSRHPAARVPPARDAVGAKRDVAARGTPAGVRGGGRAHAARTRAGEPRRARSRPRPPRAPHRPRPRAPRRLAPSPRRRARAPPGRHLGRTPRSRGRARARGGRRDRVGACTPPRPSPAARRAPPPRTTRARPSVCERSPPASAASSRPRRRDPAADDPNEPERTTRTNPNARAPRAIPARRSRRSRPSRTRASTRGWSRPTPPALASNETRPTGSTPRPKTSRAGGRSRRALAAGFGRWVVAHAALGTALRDPKAGVAPVEDEPEDESEFASEFESGEETGDRGARAGSNTRVEKDEEKNEPSRSPGGIEPEPEPEPPRRGGVSSASAAPSLIAPWARAAIGAASSAAEAARDASSGSSDPASRRAGALLFALAADRSERTARAVANWATHQPRLWPTRRAIGDLCVTLGELERVADAFDDAAGTFEAAAGAFEPVVENKAFLHSTGDSAAAAEDSKDSAAAEDASADASAARVAAARARFAADRVRAALARLADAVVCATERVAADALEGLPASEKKKTERAADGPPGGFVPAAAAALRASAFLPLAAALRRVPPRVAHRVGPSAADAAVRALLARRAAGAASGSAGAKKSKTSAAASAALAAEVEALAAAARETLGADAWGTTAWGASEAAAYASTLRRARARGRGGGGRGVVAARAKGGEKGATRGAAEDVVRVSFLRIVQKWMTIETRNAPPSVDDERASARFGAATLLTPGIVRGARDSEVARVLVSFDSISPGVVTKVRRRVFVSRATDSRRPEVAPRSAPRAEAPDEGEPRAFFSRRSGSARFGSVRSWPIGVRGDR